MHKLTLITTALLALLARPTQAATITSSSLDQNDYVITVKGELVFGDEKVFGAVVNPNLHGIVSFDSPGGNAYAGIKIGTVIHNLKYETVVLPNSLCTSACALAWLGGIKLWADQTAHVGFHGVFDNDTHNIMPEGNALVGAYMNMLGLSDNAIVYMTEKGPDEMQWLTPVDAKALSIVVYEYDTMTSMLEPAPAPTYEPAPAPTQPAPAPPPVVMAPPLTPYEVEGQERARQIADRLSRSGTVNWSKYGKWIQAASRQDLNEAIHVASDISMKTDISIAVMPAINGWYAVLLGPYRGTPTGNLAALIQAGTIPDDSMIKVGKSYGAILWASPSWFKTS